MKIYILTEAEPKFFNTQSKQVTINEWREVDNWLRVLASVNEMLEEEGYGKLWRAAAARPCLNYAQRYKVVENEV